MSPIQRKFREKPVVTDNDNLGEAQHLVEKLLPTAVKSAAPRGGSVCIAKHIKQRVRTNSTSVLRLSYVVDGVVYVEDDGQLGGCQLVNDFGCEYTLDEHDIRPHKRLVKPAPERSCLSGAVNEKRRGFNASVCK
jgi:hypothetical protein